MSTPEKQPKGCLADAIGLMVVPIVLLLPFLGLGLAVFVIIYAARLALGL